MPGRDVEGVHHTQQGAQHQDVPDLNGSAEGQGGEQESEDHRRGLGDDDDATAVVPIRQGAADRGQQEDGNLTRESDRPQQDRRAGEAVDEPRLGDALHPGAGKGDE